MAPAPRILIVDDDPFMRETFQVFLDIDGYDIRIAENGVAALARLEEIAADVILLDIMMPDMDGLEVCRRLKADERYRHIPVILVTALEMRDHVVRGLEAGADELVSKPVSAPELRARVRAMLRLKKQYDELVATLHLREALTHMIVHDMRSPLSVIRGYGELLLVAGSLSAEDRRCVQAMATQAERLNTFINDFLLMAKMQAGSLLLNRTDVDLKALAQELLHHYDLLAQSKSIRLRFEAPATLPVFSLDQHLWERLVDNLLSNALKFAPPNSTVMLKLSSSLDAQGQPHLFLRLFDEGPGIAPEHRQRIFEAYEIIQLHRAGTPQVGLGLAFCKMVVEAHGGRIWVEANQPQGSIFSVEI